MRTMHRALLADCKIINDIVYCKEYNDPNDTEVRAIVGVFLLLSLCFMTVILCNETCNRTSYYRRTPAVNTAAASDAT